MEKEIKKPEIVDSGIDKDVLEAMAQDNLLKTITDEKQMRRAELNFLCELLSQMKDLNRSFDGFMETLSVCSADKLTDFFAKLQTNVKDEEKRMAVKEKMSKGYKKSTKKSKRTSNIVTFDKNSVK